MLLGLMVKLVKTPLGILLGIASHCEIYFFLLYSK